MSALIGPLTQVKMKDEPEKKSVTLLDEPHTNGRRQPSASVDVSSGFHFECLVYKEGVNITEIILNRPEKKNAFSLQMYKEVTSALRKANENETVVVTLKGEGDFFSSGHDLNNFIENLENPVAAAKYTSQIMREFVDAFIDFPKILVAVVNGPAIGMGAMILGLCDVVYASDKATFYSPFIFLGQTSAGCASYTFPKIMGFSKANEVLLFGRKLCAVEAKESGLVAEVFPHDSFQKNVIERLSFLPDASKNSMLHAKEIIRCSERACLRRVNEAECDRFVERCLSSECVDAVMKFFQNRS